MKSLHTLVEELHELYPNGKFSVISKKPTKNGRIYYNLDGETHMYNPEKPTQPREYMAKVIQERSLKHTPAMLKYDTEDRTYKINLPAPQLRRKQQVSWVPTSSAEGKQYLEDMMELSSVRTAQKAKAFHREAVSKLKAAKKQAAAVIRATKPPKGAHPRVPLPAAAERRPKPNEPVLAAHKMRDSRDGRPSAKALEWAKQFVRFSNKREWGHKTLRQVAVALSFNDEVAYIDIPLGMYAAMQLMMEQTSPDTLGMMTIMPESAPGGITTRRKKLSEFTLKDFNDLVDQIGERYDRQESNDWLKDGRIVIKTFVPLKGGATSRKEASLDAWLKSKTKSVALM